MTVGDIVLIKNDTLARNHWLMGRVIETKPDSKGYVRSVILKTSTAELHRLINKLVILLENKEVQKI